MPGYDNDEFDDDYGNGPKALRDALKKAQDELKARDKELDALRQTNESLTKQVKTTTLRDALTDAGVDPKYARFAERDGVEADAEAVKKWVEESREVYAFLATKPATNEDPADESDQGGDDNVDPELMAQILAAQRVETSGRPSGSTTIESVLEGTDPSQFKSQADFNAFLAKLGAPVLG